MQFMLVLLSVEQQTVCSHMYNHQHDIQVGNFVIRYLYNVMFFNKLAIQHFVAFVLLLVLEEFNISLVLSLFNMANFHDWYSYMEKTINA